VAGRCATLRDRTDWREPAGDTLPANGLWVKGLRVDGLLVEGLLVKALLVKGLRLVPLGGADYSPRTSAERSAARLAHQSGGLGVPSSNLGAPTTYSL
jgi:hypothetical protein